MAFDDTDTCKQAFIISLVYFHLRFPLQLILVLSLVLPYQSNGINLQYSFSLILPPPLLIIFLEIY